MTANTTATRAEMVAGAASHRTEDWPAIDWHKANQTVHRLQARIVKATQKGRWGKALTLPHLLTHSFSAKALAVRRVTENQGKRTPGVDRITWDTPQHKAKATLALHQRGYQPRPLRRVYIAKSNGGRRPLSIPTMHDRAMQALYLLALDPIAETTADPNSYGFRNCRAPADAVEQCFNTLAKPTSPEWVLEGDLRACFDTISHEWLEAHIPMDKTILHKWLKAGFMEKGVLHPTQEGCPQGGICSPVIANMTLDGLESCLRSAFPRYMWDNHTRKRWYPKVNLSRFADDFIIIGASKELLEDEVKPLVEAFMKERGLELSPEKTTITHIANGFDFLGQNIRKYHGKLLIKPAVKSIKSLLRKVRTVIKANKSAGGIVHAVGSVNFLFDASQTPHLKASELYAHFGLSTSTGGAKSKQIRDLLKISIFDPAWTLPSRVDDNPMIWNLSVNRLIVDIRQAPLPLQLEAYNKGLIPYVPAFKEEK